MCSRPVWDSDPLIRVVTKETVTPYGRKSFEWTRKAPTEVGVEERLILSMNYLLSPVDRWLKLGGPET
jgi:hypothetical protein